MRGGLAVTQTLRVLNLLRELPRGQGYDSTARLLAERLGVSERTAYRDLEALQVAGFAAPHDARGYYLLATDQTAPQRLTAEEVAALAYSAQWIAVAVPDDVRESVEAALDKLAASVVFSTATQPAFAHLGGAVRRYCNLGWQPREIVPAGCHLFAGPADQGRMAAGGCRSPSMGRPGQGGG
jgi:hypothetical protein